MVSSKAYPRLVVQAFSGSLAPTMLLDVCFQPWLRSTPGGVFREAVPHCEVERYYFFYIVGFIVALTIMFLENVVMWWFMFLCVSQKLCFECGLSTFVLPVPKSP